VNFSPVFTERGSALPLVLAGTPSQVVSKQKTNTVLQPCLDEALADQRQAMLVALQRKVANLTSTQTRYPTHSIWQLLAALNLLKLFSEFQLNKIEGNISAGLYSKMAVDTAAVVVPSHFIQQHSKKLHGPAQMVSMPIKTTTGLP